MKIKPQTSFVYGKGHHKTLQQRQYEKLKEYTTKLEEVYVCEDCSGGSYATQCKKADKNRTIRINRELTSIHIFSLID